MYEARSDECSYQQELDRMNAAIETYAVQIDKLDGALQAIHEENSSDELTRQAIDYQAAYELDPANIPAEDALETITRLQNTLKIVKRRNHLLVKENATQQKLLEDRSKILMRETKLYDEIVDKTGWHEEYRCNVDDAKKEEDIHAMTQLEPVIRKELRGAQCIIKKKEALIRELEMQVEKGAEVEAELNTVYNDIRVKDRDCQQLSMKLEQMQRINAKNDEALVLFESQKQNASLMYMEDDKEFLKEAVAQMKAACRRQDCVIKTQMMRQQQLHTRLEIIMKSLREMKLDKEYERNISKTALVPSASREEPDDVSRILPKDELIPVHTYRLIYKNNEMMRTNVARKEMLALEKEAVIQSLHAILSKYANALNLTFKQQEDLKLNKDLEMGELMEELQKQHQNHIQQLDQLIEENNYLKKKFYRAKDASRVAIKNH